MELGGGGVKGGKYVKEEPRKSTFKSGLTSDLHH